MPPTSRRASLKLAFDTSLLIRCSVWHSEVARYGNLMSTAYGQTGTPYPEGESTSASYSLGPLADVSPLAR
jgi:hypothetical protein